MHLATRRRFIQLAGLCFTLNAAGGCFGAQSDEPREQGRFDGEPRLKHRGAQHYLAVRSSVSMQELGSVLQPSWKEVHAWMVKHGVSPAGPPIIRYLLIEMSSRLDIDVGFPVAAPIRGTGRVHAGTLPGGEYAVVTYEGPYQGLVSANAKLQRWAKSNQIQWQAHHTKLGAFWSSRVEFYPTDPAEEPDPTKWKTEIAYMISSRRSHPAGQAERR